MSTTSRRDGATAAREDSDKPGEPILRRFFEETPALPLSFELFPPPTEQARHRLAETVDRLGDVARGGFSVTMGAGGSTRTGTHETCVAVARASGRPVMAHLTALGLTKEQVLDAAEGFWDAGITRVLALRGDPPRAARGPLPPTFAHAGELVAALRARHAFEIAVAAYPEKHPEAASLDSDIDRLKEKLDAGATTAVCQFVLNPEAYARFLEACTRHGISAPVVPGLMPLEGWPRVRGFAKANAVSVPRWLDQLFASAEETPEIAPMLSAVATVEQARRLIAYGAPALHVYTMNRWQLPLALSALMGRRARA